MELGTLPRGSACLRSRVYNHLQGGDGEPFLTPSAQRLNVGPPRELDSAARLGADEGQAQRLQRAVGLASAPCSAPLGPAGKREAGGGRARFPWRGTVPGACLAGEAAVPPGVFCSVHVVFCRARCRCSPPRTSGPRRGWFACSAERAALGSPCEGIPPSSSPESSPEAAQP